MVGTAPAAHRFILHPTFPLISRGSISSTPHSMPRFGFAISHGGAAPSGAALSLGRRGAILSASHDEGAVLSLGAAWCKGMITPVSHDEGAVLSSGAARCKGMITPASYDEGAVPLFGWGASVSCGSARVLASHARGTEVAVVMGVAVGAGADVASGVSRGSLCRVEASLAPQAES